MSTLQEQLQEEVAEYGQDSPIAQILRDQLKAQQSGQSFQEMYVTGAIKIKRTC
jgi:hypothetical protein